MNDEIVLKEAAALLGLTVPGVFRHIQSGKLPARKITGKCWVVRKSDLERFKTDRYK
jgi:excisionase family DNA binding protein